MAFNRSSRFHPDSCVAPKRRRRGVLSLITYAHVLGTGEDELLGERAVGVSYLKTVAGFDLLARLLADEGSFGF